jgi:hypothetical protein
MSPPRVYVPINCIAGRTTATIWVMKRDKKRYSADRLPKPGRRIKLTFRLPDDKCRQLEEVADFTRAVNAIIFSLICGKRNVPLADEP